MNNVHHIGPHEKSTTWGVSASATQTQTVVVELGVDYRDLFMGVLMGIVLMGIVTAGIVFGLLKRIRYYEQLEAYDAGEDDEYERWEAQSDNEGPAKKPKGIPTPNGDKPTPGGEEETVVKQEPQGSLKKLKTFVNKLNPSFTTVSTKVFMHMAPNRSFAPTAHAANP